MKINLRTWTAEEVKGLLDKSDKMVLRAVCRLAVEQTPDEKSSRQSIWENRRGFMKQHGCLVVYAERIWNGGDLTQDETEFLRYRMRKYARQLAAYARFDSIGLGL